MHRAAKSSNACPLEWLGPLPVAGRPVTPGVRSGGGSAGSVGPAFPDVFVWVIVGPLVAADVGAAVVVVVGVMVLVGANVEIGVLEEAKVGDCVGDGVSMFVDVGVDVAASVGVMVGVGVTVCVGPGVGVGPGVAVHSPSRLTTA